MTTHSFEINKLAEIEKLLPGFRKIWPVIKSACGTTQRCPKRVVFTDTPEPVILHDGEIGKRFTLDLATMELGQAQHISSGEWACHAGDNHDRAVVGIPTTHAVLICDYHDYYRSFTVRVQVTKLPEHLTTASV